MSSWEKRFDKLAEDQHEFEPSSAKDICQVCGKFEEDHFPLGDKVKQFISQELKKAREETKEEILPDLYRIRVNISSGFWVDTRKELKELIERLE